MKKKINTKNEEIGITKKFTSLRYLVTVTRGPVSRVLLAECCQESTERNLVLFENVRGWNANEMVFTAQHNFDY